LKCYQDVKSKRVSVLPRLQSSLTSQHLVAVGPVQYSKCASKRQLWKLVTLTFLTKSCSSRNRRRVFRWWLIVARHDLRSSMKRSKGAFPTFEQLWTLLPSIVKLLHAVIDRSNLRQNITLRWTRFISKRKIFWYYMSDNPYCIHSVYNVSICWNNIV